MNRNQNRYWPFDVLPPEQQTVQHRREIRFLESAHREGYKPYTFGSENFGATAGLRGGVIIFRGQKRWEVALGAEGETALSMYFADFNNASETVLQWLRGADAATLLSQNEKRI